ncbi:Cbt1p [Lachancea thermotolerans CBS 6340]|uniref:KLTH0C02244p n=1 Tax=Lachancea thermotolerans (strain ATCC 56472 / CBS 6340 / NRRL Y-8284) TaxID=559295 RepID=C5DDM6_LACTC|nr:KLTH0C02244p [Lachancea thermotolerans CBS 6340]CAR21887.1 KLTH0C02244p [Lachancea thermotolerans CBS 6340]
MSLISIPHSFLKCAMSGVSRRFGDILGISKSITRYGGKHSGSRSKLERKVLEEMTAGCYSRYLANYNCFVLLQWREIEGVGRANRARMWRRLCEGVNEAYRTSGAASGAASSAENIGIPPSPVFFEHPLDTRLFARVLQTKHLCQKQKLLCSFQRLSSPESATALLQYLELAAKPADRSDGDAAFEPVVVGVKLASRDSSVVSHIQPLLEESSKMYQDLNYEKLLQIAKCKSIGDADPAKSQAKKVLVALAENKLSKPRLADNQQWLLFTSYAQG